MSKKRSNRWVIALFADIHCGSRLALLPPGMVLYTIGLTGAKEPWTPSLTPGQVELWELYQEHIKAVMKFADGDPVCVVLVGDPTQGGKFKDELVCGDIPNQVAIASACIEEWLKYGVKYLRLAAGTDVHEFGESAATRLLAEYLAVKYPKVSVEWTYHELLDIEGVTIDFAHHGPGAGKRIWLEMNNALWYLRDIVWRHIRRGQTPPILVVRADKHSYGKCAYTLSLGDRDVTTTMFVIPSYQTLTNFARKVTQSAYEVYHGMIAVEVIDGELARVKRLVQLIDLRRKESLK